MHIHFGFDIAYQLPSAATTLLMLRLRPEPVSYTHLDVYKRQLQVLSDADASLPRNRDP